MLLIKKFNLLTSPISKIADSHIFNIIKLIKDIKNR
jgi:hypothetical protein